ncbi:NAD-dependent epimerase/dehydratase family protein [Chloroflexota bacterium]
MEGQKVLVVGASGFVGYRLALHLCQNNEVYGLARFRDVRVKQQLESKGVVCISKDLSNANLDDLPQDFDYFFNELIMTDLGSYAERQREAFELNGQLVGRLMSHCRSVRGMVQTSTSGVYRPSLAALKEDDFIGPPARLATYGISKFNGEAIATFSSNLWNIPTAILRLSYPYSDEGGLVFMFADMIAQHQPITINKSMGRCYNPIHLSDFIRYSENAVNFCSIPPRVMNAAGSEVVSIPDLLNMIGEALGTEPIIIDTDETQIPLTEPTFVLDTTLLTSLMGEPSVKLDEGISGVAQRILQLKSKGDSIILTDGKARDFEE